MMMKRLLVLPLAALIGTACSEGIVEPPPEVDAPVAAASVELAASLPGLIALPVDFQPEGIATGRGASFYVGSLADGRIYKGSLLDGSGSILVPPTGGLAVGLDLDERSNLLWVADGFGGGAQVYDGGTGALVAGFDFGGSFINDVIVGRDAAYFTDSFSPVLYRVPVTANGQPGGGFQAVPLGGDFQSIPGTFNANGIEVIPGPTPTLLVVNGSTARLYTVDPETGEGSLVQGVSVPSGDGLVLDGGRTLYVVQNFLNQIAEVRLSPDLASGEVVNTLTSPGFRIPTTAARFGSALYAVNARFDVVAPGSPPGGFEFEVVRVER